MLGKHNVARKVGFGWSFMGKKSLLANNTRPGVLILYECGTCVIDKKIRENRNYKKYDRHYDETQSSVK